MNIEIVKKNLPIGSIVSIKEKKIKFMIIGYYPIKEGKKYDYFGVTYPFGIIDTKKIYMFYAKDISNVFYRGYENEEYKGLLKELEK